MLEEFSVFSKELQSDVTTVSFHLPYATDFFLHSATQRSLLFYFCLFNTQLMNLFIKVIFLSGNEFICTCKQLPSYIVQSSGYQLV